VPPDPALLYADEDLDRHLVNALRQRGFDVLATLEARRQEATDEAQLAYATSLGRILVTHNRLDFLRLHTAWQARGQLHAGIVILPQTGPVIRRSIRTALLVNWLRASGSPASRLAVWGHLQSLLQGGLRPEGFSPRELQVALGLAE
jgi:predicted nuclease of predicted toxin-antitoxin system